MSEQSNAEKKLLEKGFLENVDLDAVGRHVSQAVMEWFFRPETLQTLLDVFTKNRKLIRKLARPKRHRVSSSTKPCSEEGCEEPVRARGLCGKHYSRVRYQEAKINRPEAQIRGVGVCSEDGCEKPVHARGMCGRHFMEWVRAKRTAPTSSELRMTDD